MTFDLKSKPPVAARRPVETSVHGNKLVDDYGWLRADNWREVMQDPSQLADDIRDYLEAENAYQKSVMVDSQGLQQALYKEMRGRIKEDDSSVPMKDGPWRYGVSFVEDGEHARYVRLAANQTNEQVILDGNLEAQGKTYFRITGSSHSPDHSRLAWAADDKGSELSTVRIRDIASATDLPDKIERTNGNVIWSRDSKSILYTKLDQNHRPSSVQAHRVCDDSKDDTTIYQEPDGGFFVGIGNTQSRNFIVIDAHDHETSESWLVPANDVGSTPILFRARQTGVEYSLDEGGGYFYILTNLGDAKDFCICRTPVDDFTDASWEVYVPHAPGRLIASHMVLANHLVWLERRDGLPQIVVKRLTDGGEHAIVFAEDAYSLGLIGNYEFDTTTIRFSYSSMATPAQVFDYNLETHERSLLKSQEIPSGHNVANYATKRIFATAKDGAEVPISLLWHKDTPLDGTAPCLLYGYGAYGISIPASFSTNALSLVERGFVYAIAHVRGGKDKGFAWYEDGKRLNKRNTFDDFVACAQHLIEQRYTGHGQIVAQGGSAGGMLMGVIANQAPELFAGIIAEVPFVDVLNTMLDDSLPLTPPEWPEWGNPINSKTDYNYIAGYSPYDRVTAQSYPAILAVGGLSDPRVTYWEPAKWVAKLRCHHQDSQPILLKTNMEAGHGGASGRFSRLHEVALGYAFALMAVGRA